MAVYYKLTNAQDQTRGPTQWGPGVSYVAMGSIDQGGCSDAYIHAYEHPLLAVLHDPIGANFGPTAHLWECESDDEPLRDRQMKLGVRSLMTLRRIELPEVTAEQRVRYAILCGKAVYHEPSWTTWADNWLSGVDRGRSSAVDAAVAAADAAVAWATACAAVAWATADAALAAADAAVAWATACAADATVAWATADAARATDAAWARVVDIDLIAIALEAVS